MPDSAFLQFPPDFTWGTATSAYQIEGSCNSDGRGPSIWDTFSHQPGRTYRGQTGDTAADHYQRWQSDLDLLAGLRVNAYRFSIAWTRVVPDGRGPVNAPGLDFYDRLVDGLLERGITPYPTLFHYDLPQPLQDTGGWPARETAGRFAEYAETVGRRLADRCTHWITHNEPWVAAVLGHLTGEHAPGWHNPVAAFTALHHMLVSHGLAVQGLRASTSRPLKIGIALNLSPVYPARSFERDKEAVALVDAFANRLSLDPLLIGRYPDAFTASRLWRLFEGPIHAGDMELISQPLDFIGVNYYTRAVVRHVPLLPPITVRPEGDYSQMWEIYPAGLYDLLLQLHGEYAHPNLIVLENGVPVPDFVESGHISDARRVRFLHDHIIETHRAMAAGVPVRGYFVWSFLDNFEWKLGYKMRFGLTYVDFKTQARIVKASGSWYAGVIAANGLTPGLK